MKHRVNFFYLYFSILFSLFSFHFLHAADFGFIINNYGSCGAGESGKGAFEYKSNFIPRFSFLTGENGGFMTSLSFTADYAHEKVSYVPELMRTELSARLGAFGLRLGRFTFADPSAHVANGLFDGFQLTHVSTAGRFGIGAWYAGFLYKKTADIRMTAADRVIYETPFEFEKFTETYFAPKRALASADWGHPSLGEFMRLNIAITGQMDLNDDSNEAGGSKLNSGYFTIKTGFPVKGILFELAGTGAVLQLMPPEKAAEYSFGFTGDFGILWTMPTSFASRLALRAGYASGNLNDNIKAFIPVTTKYCGDIFQADFTGNASAKLNYTARFAGAFGADVTASYFLRNDLNQTDYPVAVKPAFEKYLLGAEFFARLVWSPVSDLQFTLGGGAFVPALGDVWADESPRWKADLTAVVAIF